MAKFNCESCEHCFGLGLSFSYILSKIPRETIFSDNDIANVFFTVEDYMMAIGLHDRDEAKKQVNEALGIFFDLYANLNDGTSDTDIARMITDYAVSKDGDVYVGIHPQIVCDIDRYENGITTECPFYLHGTCRLKEVSEE